MKNRFFLIPLLTLLSFPAFAQSGEKPPVHWDIRGGMSAISVFTTGAIGPRSTGSFFGNGRRSLASVYGDYNGDATATNNFGDEALIRNHQVKLQIFSEKPQILCVKLPGGFGKPTLRKTIQK